MGAAARFAAAASRKNKKRRTPERAPFGKGMLARKCLSSSEWIGGAHTRAEELCSASPEDGGSAEGTEAIDLIEVKGWMEKGLGADCDLRDEYAVLFLDRDFDRDIGVGRKRGAIDVIEYAEVVYHIGNGAVFSVDFDAEANVVAGRPRLRSVEHSKEDVLTWCGKPDGGFKDCVHLLGRKWGLGEAFDAVEFAIGSGE